MALNAVEAPSYMDFTMEKQSLETSKGGDSSQAEQYAILSRERDLMESDVIGEVELLYLPISYLERYGNLPQLLLPSSHHEQQLTSTVGVHNVANAESSLDYTSKSGSTIINESSGNKENLSARGERYIGINEFAGFVSPIPQDDENNI